MGNNITIRKLIHNVSDDIEKFDLHEFDKEVIRQSFLLGMSSDKSEYKRICNYYDVSGEKVSKLKTKNLTFYIKELRFV